MEIPTGLYTGRAYVPRPRLRTTTIDLEEWADVLRIYRTDRPPTEDDVLEALIAEAAVERPYPGFDADRNGYQLPEDNDLISQFAVDFANTHPIATALERLYYRICDLPHWAKRLIPRAFDRWWASVGWRILVSQWDWIRDYIISRVVSAVYYYRAHEIVGLDYQKGGN